MKLYGFLAATLGVFGLAGAASAFDTGHHSDLTREALAEFRMSEDAIQTAQVENWLVDYYSNQPLAGLGGDLEKLHFDKLTTTDQVRNYWGRLTVNTKSAVEAAARAKNPTQVVALLGMSLHAVQDFYTHSNWVETQPAGGSGYATRTWFDATPAPGATSPVTGAYPNSSPIRATDHGDYRSGMNHDSYVRPRWDESYVYAYSASRQWVAAVERWVSAIDPGVWASARGLSLSAANRSALQVDLNAAYRISEWVATPGNNGHWKGDGSGSILEFGSFTLAWTTGSNSIFVNHFTSQRWHQLLTNNLTGATPPAVPVPPVPSQTLRKKAIRVRTVAVEELPVGFFETKIDVAGRPDFLARVTVEGQTFIETMQIDRPSINPAWWTIKFVDSGNSRANIRYQLFDEDSTDEVCDVNPTTGKQHLDFSLSLFGGGSVSGDLSGRAGATIVSEGRSSDSNRARVRLIIDSRDLL